MRVLIVHNRYQQRGGEDSVVEEEAALLGNRGHSVQVYSRHNDEIAGMAPWKLAAATLWSRRAAGEIGALIRDFAPDIMHVHNTFPLISPSIYWAARRLRVPVVQTLHNFRLLCPQATFLRDGRICESCLGRLPLPGLIHGCYRDSHAQTAVAGTMLMAHCALGTYRHAVTRYIALNEFCRDKFIAGGLPAGRIAIKPNFVDHDPPPTESPRDGFLYVGRLSKEKGIATLKQALALAAPGTSLRVAGSGPEADLLAGIAGVEMLGALPGAAVFEAMQRASALVLPSICYETFGKVVVEAFACALPVIASRLGALRQMVEEGETGLLFEAGNAADLAAKLDWARSHPAEMARMGRNARRVYEQHYTADANYAQLMRIYQEAIDDERSRC